MNLKEILRPVLTEEELHALVQSYDVVGDIAIIIVQPELEHRQSLIAEAVLRANKNIRVVAKRAGHYQTELRTIELEIIGGENRKETIHKEYGIRLKLDPGKVYFSVRSGSERKRIADLVAVGEAVLVMFSGVAPYPLHIARFSESSTIVGVEKNPLAHRYAEENLVLNRAGDRIDLYQGDVCEILPKLALRFSRIVMPLPKQGKLFLPLALEHLRPAGQLHYYLMQRPDALDQSLLELREICRQAGRTLSHYKITTCGHTAPNSYRYCIDGLID